MVSSRSNARFRQRIGIAETPPAVFRFAHRTGKVRVMDVIRILLAIVLPPVGVFLQVGIGLHFWINILLTLLGYVPGIIHAVWVIVKK
jgi:uncharacterized membrane protein YqaE (UPF0057 family)